MVASPAKKGINEVYNPLAELARRFIALRFRGVQKLLNGESKKTSGYEPKACDSGDTSLVL
jgi:hypothetical protein